ncbi:MAG: L-threonylcarbamoyladenylate synthase [Candidatus Omnitrophica bacterium]|nr:L-threonylcarbamoyladenylate synthase [Candidatus Omnitrophota bacterium]
MTKKVFVDPNDIDKAIIQGIAKVVLDGGIIALPTETVYGLAAIAKNNEVVQRLYQIKRRPKDKPFTYVEDEIDDVINSYFSTLTPFGYRLIEKFWPGPLTIVYYSKKDEKIGVRIPSHPVAFEVIKAINQQVFLPSANISGEKEATQAEEVESIFLDKIDLIVASDPSLVKGKPSTVIDLTYKPFKILREGIISEKEIIDVFIKKRIVFVCKGNTCRSPMAQFLFSKYLAEAKPYFKDRYQVLSRGVLPFGGIRLTKAVEDILKEKEHIVVDYFQSKPIDRQTLLSSDLIFVMEDSQQEYLMSLEPTIEGRIFHLKKFLPPSLEKDIPDPIGKSYEFYEEVYKIIKKAILELVDWL